MGRVSIQPSAKQASWGKPLLWILAIGCGWTSGSVAAQGAQPGSEPAKYPLKIAGRQLDESLQEFARQSGVQVVFFSRLTEGLRAPALNGEYTVADALTALLADSKLTFRVINPQTVEIRPPASTQAPDKAGSPGSPPSQAAQVRSEAGSRRLQETVARPGRTEEVVVIGTAEQLVATRTPTALRAIPQTVSIISREQLRQQNDTDLADALSHAAGITVVRSNSLDEQFYSRGFEITSFHVDGGAALNPRINSAQLFLGTPDLSEFDHIEVLRGADALFGGNGNPGGTVSLVRKRPLPSYELQLVASIGSWDNYRAEGDLTGPLTANGALRGRLDAVYAHRDYFYDTAGQERKKIFGALEYDLTSAAMLTAGGSYQWDDATPFVNGLPLYEDGSDPRLPRNTALAFDWARYRTRVREAYVQLQQEFAGEWQLRLNASDWKGRVQYAYGVFPSHIDPLTNGLAEPPYADATSRPNTHHQTTFDATLAGAFEWFGRRQEVAIGGDYTRLKAGVRLQNYAGIGLPLSDVNSFDPAGYPDPRLTQGPLFGFDAASTLQQYGFFASMRAYLTDAWSVLGGARIGSDSIRTDATVYVGTASARISAKFGNSHVVTPYAAVMYDLNDHYSLYASYADIYLTMGETQRADGSFLGAVNGVDIETGIKGSWRNGALNGSLVLYRIAQYDVPLSDPAPRPPGAPGGCCYLPGTSKSKGADLELSGEMAPGWLIGAGYTFNMNEAAAGGDLSSFVPRHLLKLWTSKQLPGSLNRWTVGGSVHAQSSNSTNGSYCPPTGPLVGSCSGFRVEQDPYAVLDLRTSFQIDPNWQVALSVGNVFDQIYYATLGTPALNTWYGEPRNVTLRVDGRY